MNTPMISSKQASMDKYIAKHDIYHPEPIGINVRDVCRFAKSIGKKVSELTEKEVSRFATK